MYRQTTARSRNVKLWVRIIACLYWFYMTDIRRLKRFKEDRRAVFAHARFALAQFVLAMRGPGAQNWVGIRGDLS